MIMDTKRFSVVSCMNHSFGPWLDFGSTDSRDQHVSLNGTENIVDKKLFHRAAGYRYSGAWIEVAVVSSIHSMTSLLDPNAAIKGLPHTVPCEAPSGFALGDHARGQDFGNVAPTPTHIPRNLRPLSRRFQPYVNNGGTVLSVSGKDYSIVASDTRFGLGYAVPSRYVSRVIKLTDKVALASSGMHADIATLHKVLRIRLTQYSHTHQKEMSLEAVSQLLSNTLYYRRFQPYYTFNVLGGIDQSGASDMFYNNFPVSKHFFFFVCDD